MSARLATDIEPRDRAKRPNRFLAGANRLPSEDAKLPPITFIDKAGLLPRVHGGCVGMAIGPQGSHKTGLFIHLGLAAIAQHGDRVLYLAAEGPHGVKTLRLPEARNAFGMTPEKLDAHWRTCDQTFDLYCEIDRGELVETYRSFNPTLIFLDVLTKVAAGDINGPGTASDIMNAAADLAEQFGATLVIAHHPGKNVERGAMGSNLFPSRADFMWSVRHKDGVVWVHVDKMKDGAAEFTVRFVVDMTPINGVPVIRAMTETELAEHKAKVPPKPNVEAENATDQPAINRLAVDVQGVLRTIKVPTPLRDVAERMMESDHSYLEKTIERLSAKDAETLTDDEVKERCLTALTKRLQRALGSEAVPGVLHPFAEKVQKGRNGFAFKKPYRLMPLPPLPAGGHEDNPSADPLSKRSAVSCE